MRGRATLVVLVAIGLMQPWSAVASPATAGAQIWATKYNGPGGNEDRAFAIADAPAGSRVYVTGESDGGTSTGFDYATIAYNPSTGSQLWASRYDNGDSLDVALALVTSPDGTKVYVTGHSRSTTMDDYATVAYRSSTGAQLWVARYDGPAGLEDTAVSIVASPDGKKVFVTGSSETTTNAYDDYATVAYDAATGAQLWVSRYDGPFSGDDDGAAIAVSPDSSSVFVTGSSNGGFGSEADYATISYDASTGAQRWLKRYNGTGSSYDDATSIGVAPDGATVFVTGASYASGSDMDYATLAYDATTGSTLWTSRYNGPGNGFDWPEDLVPGPGGAKIFVTGYSNATNGHLDYATIAYNVATGAASWTKRYDGPAKGDDTAFAIAVNPSGTKVYVTGGSPGISSLLDIATVAYATGNGSQSWVSRFNGPGNEDDEGSDVAVSSDSTKIFITGERYAGSGPGLDYETIAYSAS